MTCSKLLEIIGLSLGFLGAICLIVHSQLTVGKTTQADQAPYKWAFTTGIVFFAGAFLLQLLGVLCDTR